MKILAQETTLFVYYYPSVMPSKLLVRKETVKMRKHLTGSPLLVQTLNLGSLFGFVPYKIFLDSKTQMYYNAPICFIRKVNMVIFSRAKFFCIEIVQKHFNSNKFLLLDNLCGNSAYCHRSHVQFRGIQLKR